ncbi:MAG: DUF853 family protein [Eubacteriales bacterium]|nr:DUF853 family protein [Eubacteriales bacterium]
MSAQALLGRNLQAGEFQLELNRLKTHAFILGMTGSGKTALAIDLIEQLIEAGTSCLIVDPKGDLTNLAFAIGSETSRAFVDPLELDGWLEALRDEGVDEARLAAYRSKLDIEIFTQGDASGHHLGLWSLSASDYAALEAADRVAYAENRAAALLELLGDSNDGRTPSLLLLSELLRSKLESSEPFKIEQLVAEILDPPFDQIGVMPLEDFCPRSVRQDLAIRLNSELASSTYALRFEGEPISVADLLKPCAPEKTAVRIISLQGLDDASRNFFLASFLNELLSYVRRSPGSDELRSVFYMDEIFGYFPPVANPPAKRAMLALLKQARASGFGLVLATQNPGDIDYKGLANIGNFFIGRLNTPRDREKILGLLPSRYDAEGNDIDNQIAGLERRHFLYLGLGAEIESTVFRARRPYSYLAGPLSLEQLERLSRSLQPIQSAPPVEQQPAAVSQPQAPPQIEPVPVAASMNSAKAEPAPVEKTAAASLAPNLPYPVYYDHRHMASESYRLCFLVALNLHYKLGRSQEEATKERLLAYEIQDGPQLIDLRAELADPPQADDLASTPLPQMGYARLSEPVMQKTVLKKLESQVIDHVYREAQLEVFYNRELKLYAREGESREAFEERCRVLAADEMETKRARIEDRAKSRVDRAEERLRVAEQRVEREKERLNQSKLRSGVNAGTAILNMVLGAGQSSGHISRVSNAIKSATHSKERSAQLQLAEETFETRQQELEALEIQAREESAEIDAKIDEIAAAIETKALTVLKKDIVVSYSAMYWRA